jgi:hypothetical protein
MISRNLMETFLCFYLRLFSFDLTCKRASCYQLSPITNQQLNFVSFAIKTLMCMNCNIFYILIIWFGKLLSYLGTSPSSVFLYSVFLFSLVTLCFLLLQVWRQTTQSTWYVVLPAAPPPASAVPGTQVANQEPTTAAPASFPAAGLGSLLQDLGCYRGYC